MAAIVGFKPELPAEGRLNAIPIKDLALNGRRLHRFIAHRIGNLANRVAAIPSLMSYRIHLYSSWNGYSMSYMPVLFDSWQQGSRTWPKPSLYGYSRSLRSLLLKTHEEMRNTTTPYIRFSSHMAAFTPND